MSEAILFRGPLVVVRPLSRDRTYSCWKRQVGGNHVGIQCIGGLHARVERVAMIDVTAVQGRYAEALPLLKRALSTRENALGIDHPQVASSLDSLGALFETQVRFGKIALHLFTVALPPRRSPQLTLSRRRAAVVLGDAASVDCGAFRPRSSPRPFVLLQTAFREMG